METKFKDFLLYSLACVGAVSLFLSAYQPQQTTSTVPESHVWTTAAVSGYNLHIYNKQTGEVRQLYGNSNEYIVYKEYAPKEKKKEITDISCYNNTTLKRFQLLTN